MLLDNNIFDNEHLYHLNTKKNYVLPSSSDVDLYDFHQRKSKEIRRLQYVAGLEKRKKKKAPVKVETPPRVITPPGQPSPEPSPIEFVYPVWVVHKKIPYPADLRMTLPPGTEVNNEGLLEVREGDWVDVDVKPINPKNWEGKQLTLKSGMVLPDLRAKLNGTTAIPTDLDGDCDFVVLDDRSFDGDFIPEGKSNNNPSFRIPQRYPILTYFREMAVPSPLDESNCEVYDEDPDNNFNGRGNFKLLDQDGNHVKWAKAILSDNQNKLSYVLVKRESDNKIWLRYRVEGKLQTFAICLETYVIEELLYFKTIQAYVTRLTLKEELVGGVKVKIPRQIYFIEGQECLENLDILHGMYAFCKCEDGEDYYGTIEYDGDFGVKMILDKSKYKYEDDYVRVVVDDPEMLENYKNITDVFDKIEFMNDFRVGGPWIARKDTADACSGYQYTVPTSEIGIGTEAPQLKSQGVGTEPPKMVSQSVDAVCEPKGLRLDNLEFGIVDGSGRRLKVIVSNELDESVQDSQVEIVEFYKSSGVQGGQKKIGVTVGEHGSLKNDLNGKDEGYTPVDVVENQQLDQEQFEGQVQVDFGNDMQDVSFILTKFIN